MPATEISRSPDGRSDSIRSVMWRKLPVEVAEIDEPFGGHVQDRRLRRGSAVRHAVPGGESRRAFPGAGCGTGSPSSPRCRSAISAVASRVAGCGAGSPSSARCRAAISATASSIDTLSAFAAARLRAGAGAAGRSIGRRGCAGAPVSRPLRSASAGGGERRGATQRRRASLRARTSRRAMPFDLLGQPVEAASGPRSDRCGRCGVALEIAGAVLAALARSRSRRGSRGSARLLIVVALPQLTIVATVPRSTLIAREPGLPVRLPRCRGSRSSRRERERCAAASSSASS